MRVVVAIKAVSERVQAKGELALRDWWADGERTGCVDEGLVQIKDEHELPLLQQPLCILPGRLVGQLVSDQRANSRE